MKHQEYFRSSPDSTTAVLMLHGILGTPDHFRQLRELVPQEYTVHCLLLPGHGGTVEDFSRSSMAQWKETVFSRVESLLQTHQRLYIAAHSMGTLFAIQAAVAYPDRIAGLFLLGSPMRVFVRPATAVNSVRLTFGLVDPESRSALDMRDGLSVTPTKYLWKYIPWIPRFLELFREIHITRKLLPRLQVPTQVFQSKNDELVSYSSCMDLLGYEAIDCFGLRDSGHFGYGTADMALLRRQFTAMLGA